MKTFKYLLSCASLVALTLAQPINAQVKLADDAYPVIITPHRQTVSYRERTLCYEITANVDFTVTADADWATVRKAGNGTVYIHLKTNEGQAARVANVVFANAENNLSETLTITQSRNELVEEIYSEDFNVKVASATANTQQGGNGIELTYDNNTSTFWHSQWTGSGFTVSKNNPAILTYNFTNVDVIDYVSYVPRRDQENGNFGEIEILAKCGTEKTYKTIVTKDLRMECGAHRIDLNLKNPVSIQFKVYSGNGNYASCAEMKFYKLRENKPESAIGDWFADEAMTKLKTGITQEQIDNIENPFITDLVQKLYDGTYETSYRVADYGAKLSPTVQAEIWNAPGKLYDQTQGVTGINIRKGKHGIAVSGLPEGETLPLRVIAWYIGKVGSSFDGGDPVDYNYNLHNGFNVIEYDGDYDGLAYVRYYVDANPQLRDPVKVHFINGEVNGYLSLDKTNEEMHGLLAVAPNYCMDVVGNNVHSVWTSRGIPNVSTKGLHGECKATDNASLGYRQFMHMLDSLVIWEHELLGFHKYNRTPDNRTMAYVNFTYYMFQGGKGVSFHADQEHRVLNCRTMIMNDDDAIWGLSHEWGHQHQMTPYFNWAGMSEVTNNMNSYYNIMRMGYRRSEKIQQWTPARKHFIKNDYSDITPGFKGSRTTSSIRRQAYLNASNFSYSTDMRDLCLAMKDSTVYSTTGKKERSLSINEVGVGETLCPFIMLYNYFTTHGIPDFAPDWYEALRQNDDENGSQIEKKGEADKYELVASAQNNNKNNKYAELKSKYPNSAWVTKNYVTSSSTMWDNSVPYILNFIRKTSRLSGYNLMPYFEQWGFLRQIAALIGDYGNKWYVMTPDMYNEFKADMDALVQSGELKAMPEGMVEEISNSPEMFQNAPVFEN